MMTHSQCDGLHLKFPYNASVFSKIIFGSKKLVPSALKTDVYGIFIGRQLQHDLIQPPPTVGRHHADIPLTASAQAAPWWEVIASQGYLCLSLSLCGVGSLAMLSI